MRIIKYVKMLTVVGLITGMLSVTTILNTGVNAQTTTVQKPVQSTVAVDYIQVVPLTIVNNPKLYLNKNISMIAKFDKFSTLGLDYKPAYKSSDDYISFLVKRDDTSYNIPLSEMKLFLKRDTAEKFIELKTNDKIQVKGLVFSDALGDAWVDVKEIQILEKAPEEKK